MKISRLLEIAMLLMNRKTITAHELAERFGVSVRTIYRDIDILGTSGVPVYTTKGAGGGISILEGYSVNNALLSDSDKNNMLAALQALKAARFPEADAVLEKLGAIFKTSFTDWITVDFTPWGADQNDQNRFNELKRAILSCTLVEFDYVSAENIMSRRRIEPLRLIYKEHSWYLWGFCLLREDYRMFKLTRIIQLEVTTASFDRGRLRLTEHPSDDTLDRPERLVDCVLHFSEEARFRIYDDFSRDLISENEDGSFTVYVTYPYGEWIYGYLMSFGAKLRVLEPAEVREGLLARMAAAFEQYRQQAEFLK